MRITTAASIFIFGLGGICCNSPPPVQILETDTAHEANKDTANIRADTETSTGEPDVIEEGDLGSNTSAPPDTGPPTPLPKAGCPNSQQMATSPFVCENNQKKAATYKAQPSKHIHPSHPDLGANLTASGIRDDFGGSLPETAGAFGFPREHQPLSTHNVGFAEFGDDVTVRIATIHPRENYGDSTMFFTALLNYKPTQSTYRHYNGERTKVLKRRTDDHLWIPVDGPIELVDITIPAEAFDRRGRYDLAIGWGDRGPLSYTDRWDSVHIYYGGCSPPDHQCAERGDLHETTEVEQRIRDKYWVTAHVYPHGELKGRDPFKPIQVDAGQEVTIKYSLSVLSNWDTTWMLVPVVNGRPLDKRRHVFVPQHTSEPRKIYLGSPGTFSIPIPDKPGKYEVEIATWNTPYLSYEETGTGLNPRPDNSTGSNSLIFVVKE